MSHSDVTIVAAFDGMDGNTQLKHLERRHDATGFKSPAEWAEWHEAAHSAGLSHVHTGSANLSAPDHTGDKEAVGGPENSPRVPRYGGKGVLSPGGSRGQLPTGQHGLDDNRFRDGDFRLRDLAANGVPPARFVAPTPEQAAAAWSCDLRNPAFTDESPGTTVIVGADDWDEVEFRASGGMV